MMSDKKIATKIAHLDGLNYDHWNEFMENLLYKDIWSLVETSLEEPGTSYINWCRVTIIKRTP